jgi:hypothetical protein
MLSPCLANRKFSDFIIIQYPRKCTFLSFFFFIYFLIKWDSPVICFFLFSLSRSFSSIVQVSYMILFLTELCLNLNDFNLSEYY